MSKFSPVKTSQGKKEKLTLLEAMD